jgi:hypothetical protein
MNDEVTLNRSLPLAYGMFQEICQRRSEIAINFLELGRLFKAMRDERYFECLDYETFEEFLGCPEISMRRSTVYGLIQIYELFVERLKIDHAFLASIGHAKLQVISPVVRNATDPTDWIYKARELSRSDLITEVRLAQGKPDSGPPMREGEAQTLDKFQDYLAYARAHPCVVCKKTLEVDLHHFPITKGAGAPDRWVIPLCRACHTESHQDPKEFLWRWREKIFAFFYDTYDTALKALSVKNE